MQAGPAAVELEVAGIRTRGLELAGTGPPFLLLHGYSDTADTWRPLMRELAAAGRPALAVDMVGYGRAEPLEPGPVLPQLDAFVADLVAQRAAGGEKPVLVGNSLGAVAALRALEDETLPIGGVAAISPAGLGHQPWVDLMERDPVVHRLLRAPVPLPMSVVRWGIRGAYGRLAVGDHSRSDPTSAALYASQYRDRDHAIGVLTGARSLLGELHSPYRFERMTRPLMLIWGSRDLLTPTRGAKRILDTVPNARFEELAGVGHCAQVEVPAKVAELLQTFPTPPNVPEDAL